VRHSKNWPADGAMGHKRPRRSEPYHGASEKRPRELHSPTDEKRDQSGREAHDFMSQFLSKILACKLVSVACEPSLWPLLPRAPGNDSSLLRIIARAHDIQGRLSQNTKLTVHDIAREERVTAAYLYTLLRLS
jgi:hypothetical protein